MSLLLGEYPATKLIQPAWGPRYIALGMTQKKTMPSPVYCRYGRLPSDGLDIFSRRVYQAIAQKRPFVSAYCIATAVLVRLEVSAQQRVYTPQYWLHLKCKSDFRPEDAESMCPSYGSYIPDCIRIVS
jgi:hypothetical protein